MKESIKRATKENSDIIGEVFNLYRIFYNQESNLEIAPENKFGSIELSTNKANIPGQSLYESLGYIRDNEFYSYDLEI